MNTSKLLILQLKVITKQYSLTMELLRLLSYRKFTPVQHVSFLSYAKSFEYAVNMTDDVQQEFDRFYATIWDLLDRFYPEWTIVITSADPEFVTSAVKAMLWRKNRLMRCGRIDEANVLACIGRVMIRNNSVELSRVDPQDSRAMWAKVRLHIVILSRK